MNRSIALISDLNLIQRLQSLAREIIDEPWHLNIKWVAERQWVAVPVVKGRHFEVDDAKRVSRTLNRVGQKYCFAVETESVSEAASNYYVQSTEDGLLEFSETCAGLNFALFSEELSYIILCTSEDYNLYAGPRELIEHFLDADIDTARQAFREVASDEWWEGKLLQVAERYELD